MERIVASTRLVERQVCLCYTIQIFNREIQRGRIPVHINAHAATVRILNFVGTTFVVRQKVKYISVLNFVGKIFRGFNLHPSRVCNVV